MSFGTRSSPAPETRLSPPRATPAPPDPWEEAYLRFQSPEQEVRKFLGRLRRLGAGSWDRDARIVELFCGRGNGLHALARLGFRRIEGIDRSHSLVARYTGRGRCCVGDCRALPFPDRSRDVLIVQGGLHHLLELPADLERTLAEAHRVLRSGGLFLAVEPWRTPFLDLVHALSELALVRRISSKMDAFATMAEHERPTYERWLASPREILAFLERHFVPELRARRWGRLLFVGRKRDA